MSLASLCDKQITITPRTKTTSATGGESYTDGTTYTRMARMMPMDPTDKAAIVFEKKGFTVVYKFFFFDDPLVSEKYTMTYDSVEYEVLAHKDTDHQQRLFVVFAADKRRQR